MYINTVTGAYPLSESDIKVLFPNTSFANPFVPPENFMWVFPYPQPTYNPVIQRIEQAAPELTNLGHYEQRWTVIELYETQQERDTAIDANTEAKRVASVPQSVTMRQARLALHAAGLLPSVNAALEALTEPAKTAAIIEWEYAQTVDRNSGLVPELATALGMTELQIDNLFITAATL
jgi:hypothetical protein